MWRGDPSKRNGCVCCSGRLRFCLFRWTLAHLLAFSASLAELEDAVAPFAAEALAAAVLQSAAEGLLEGAPVHALAALLSDLFAVADAALRGKGGRGGGSGRRSQPQAMQRELAAALSAPAAALLRALLLAPGGRRRAAAPAAADVARVLGAVACAVRLGVAWLGPDRVLEREVQGGGGGARAEVSRRDRLVQWQPVLDALEDLCSGGGSARPGLQALGAGDVAVMCSAWRVLGRPHVADTLVRAARPLPAVAAKGAAT